MFGLDQELLIFLTFQVFAFGHTQLFGLSQQMLTTALCLMYGEGFTERTRSGRLGQLQAKFKGFIAGLEREKTTRGD